MRSRLPLRSSLVAAVVALPILMFAPTFCPGAETGLLLDAQADRLDFRLDSGDNNTPWVLQHSQDFVNWDDLMFFDEVVIGGGPPRVSVPSGALPEADARSGFFRAHQLKADDPPLREFLTERARWRLTGIRSYHYELIQNCGMISWRGTITVIDGEVTTFETIDVQPPLAEVSVPTIDELFGRIAEAMQQDAERIDVSYDLVRSYPSSCLIDPSLLIIDEEKGWSIEAFTPLP